MDIFIKNVSDYEHDLQVNGLKVAQPFIDEFVKVMANPFNYFDVKTRQYMFTNVEPSYDEQFTKLIDSKLNRYISTFANTRIENVNVYFHPIETTNIRSKIIGIKYNCDLDINTDILDMVFTFVYNK